MEHLWAPWRSDYVSRPGGNTATLFSDLAASNEDEKNLILLRGKACFGILNRYPYNTGHLMVVPYRVTPSLEDLSDDELLEMMNMIRHLKAVIFKAFKPQGYNVGINIGSVAGAGVVAHLHIHLVPRWKTDSNFMTTTAETRVHPCDLAGVYKQLKAVMDGAPSPSPAQS